MTLLLLLLQLILQLAQQLLITIGALHGQSRNFKRAGARLNQFAAQLLGCGHWASSKECHQGINPRPNECQVRHQYPGAMPEPEQIEALARQLLRVKTYRQLKVFRAQLDPATARAVITHPLITPADRGAISLLINFGQPDRYGYGEGGIVELEPCADGLGIFTLD